MSVTALARPRHSAGFFGPSELPPEDAQKVNELNDQIDDLIAQLKDLNEEIYAITGYYADGPGGLQIPSDLDDQDRRDAEDLYREYQNVSSSIDELAKQVRDLGGETNFF